LWPAFEPRGQITDLHDKIDIAGSDVTTNSETSNTVADEEVLSDKMVISGRNIDVDTKYSSIRIPNKIWEVRIQDQGCAKDKLPRKTYE